MPQLTSHAYTSAVLQKRPHPLVEMLKDLALNRSYFKPPGELQATSCQHFRRLQTDCPLTYSWHKESTLNSSSAAISPPLGLHVGGTVKLTHAYIVYEKEREKVRVEFLTCSHSSHSSLQRGQPWTANSRVQERELPPSEAIVLLDYITR